MTPALARFVHVAVWLVAGTGLWYAWMLYLRESEDEWSVLNHPWQGELQHAHILVAPVLVFGIGLIWRSHVWPKLRRNRRERRPSGWVLSLCLLPMCLSGYLLQVSVDEFWRGLWIWIHVVSSVLWLFAYVLHWWAGRSQKVQPSPVAK